MYEDGPVYANVCGKDRAVLFRSLNSTSGGLAKPRSSPSCLTQLCAAGHYTADSQPGRDQPQFGAWAQWYEEQATNESSQPLNPICQEAEGAVYPSQQLVGGQRKAIGDQRYGIDGPHHIDSTPSDQKQQYGRRHSPQRQRQSPNQDRANDDLPQAQMGFEPRRDQPTE